MSESHESYSSKKAGNTRVKVRIRKKTVGITLPLDIVKRARKHNLNISRISEQALLSVLDYLESQNNESSDFLDKVSFPNSKVGGAGNGILSPIYW